MGIATVEVSRSDTTNGVIRTATVTVVSTGAIGPVGATGPQGATGATGAGVTTGAALAAFGVGGTPPRGAVAIGALVGDEELFAGLYVLKNSIHDGSTEVGSAK